MSATGQVVGEEWRAAPWARFPNLCKKPHSASLACALSGYYNNGA